MDEAVFRLGTKQEARHSCSDCTHLETVPALYCAKCGALLTDSEAIRLGDPIPCKEPACRKQSMKALHDWFNSEQRKCQDRKILAEKPWIKENEKWLAANPYYALKAKLRR